ncbi:MAG: ribbon-helix-helix protein, CopG family [Syntrophobacteraceae bacterium]
MRHAQFTKPLTVALPPEVYDALKQKSDAKRISIAELVRQLLGETVLLSLYDDESLRKSKQNREEKRDE